MPKESETVNEQFNKFLQSNFSISQFDKTQSLTEQQDGRKQFPYNQSLQKTVLEPSSVPGFLCSEFLL
mgnify:CR=1 FL=1